jgi:cytochrome c553
MFQKKRITVGLALVLMIASTAVLAASKSKAPKATADSAQAAPAQATPPQVRPSTSLPPSDLTSPAAIKMRSGSGDPVAGDEKAALCKGCHGEVGNSTETLIPKLAGQYGKYIAKQVRNYQAGVRTHQIMGAVAATVSDEDLADISAYFASRPVMAGDGSGSDNTLGKNLFLYGDMSRMLVACVQCHGINGKGKTPDNSAFPILGGQHKDYLYGQLVNFRMGDRSNSPGGVMNIMVQRLSDAELNALAEYISGL